jgi:cell division protein FtsZ
MVKQTQANGVNVKVVGLGSAGSRVADSLAALGFPAARFLAVDTDSEKLQHCQLAEKLQLGESTRRGWGCSGDADAGAACLRTAKDALAGKLADTDLLLLVTGLAGGLGGGGAPVVAEIAADAGALVVALAIEPFDLEGLDAESHDALLRLRGTADTVVCMPNQAVMDRQPAGASVPECFEAANNLILEALLGMGRLLRTDGQMNIDFAHFRSLISGHHAESVMASLEVMGDSRPRALMDAILRHPQLEAGRLLGETDGIVLCLSSGENLPMDEVEEVMSHLRDAAPAAKLLLGVHTESGQGNGLSALVMMPQPIGKTAIEEDSEPVNRLEELPPEPVPAPETIPVAPSLWTAHQQQLPLVNISKGRFDKGEATLHNGEDLDIPTYQRRNIILN